MLDGRWVGVSSTPHKSRATLQCGSGAGWVQLCPPPVVQLCSCAVVPLHHYHLQLCIFEDICLTLDRQRIWGTKEKMCGHIARRKLSNSQALFVICRIWMGKKILKVKWYKIRKDFWILLTCRCLFSLCFQVKARTNFWDEVSAIDSQLQLLNSDRTGCWS